MSDKETAINKTAETNLEYVQRMVSSCDTKAGQRLRYIITRAQADELFAENIQFSSEFSIGSYSKGTLIALFIFKDSPEGHKYWWKIHHEVLKYDSKNH